ncbi:hypothetical protein [Sphingobium sp. SCG-1]|uniref:hypothetical protein n=1 Tax=Sphingobium sp. SCG-1 TaxID=2072936 RepID=UPI001CB962E8|nr:hypothetical protein [Sphingobium sp. SCG-1]
MFAEGHRPSEQAPQHGEDVAAIGCLLTRHTIEDGNDIDTSDGGKGLAPQHRLDVKVQRSS